MKRILQVTLFFVIFLSVFSNSAFAASDYVLPYPSAMPGGYSYKLHLFIEKLEKYWYFGSFSQFKYNLMESDKYLVETRTLFQYKQYLLGYTALLKSNDYFTQVKPQLIRAQQEGKDISQNESILKSASQKHIEELEKMENDVPESFLWQPEKQSATNLDLHSAIKKAILLRQKNL